MHNIQVLFTADQVAAAVEEAITRQNASWRLMCEKMVAAGLDLSEALAGCDEDAHECSACHGKGWNDEWKAISGHYMGGEVFRVQCDACDGDGE